MKVEIKDNKPEEFEPITLEIVIESKEELANLYHRLNASCEEIDTEANLENVKIKTNNNPVFFDCIKSLAIKEDIYK